VPWFDLLHEASRASEQAATRRSVFLIMAYLIAIDSLMKAYRMTDITKKPHRIMRHRGPILGASRHKIKQNSRTQKNYAAAALTGSSVAA
jgi:hypothetical protein